MTRAAAALAAAAWLAAAAGAQAQALAAPAIGSVPAGTTALAWAALGASGLAVLLGAAALAAALFARRAAAAAAAERRASPPPDPRLLERLDRVEAQLAAAPAARRPASEAPAPAPPTDPFPPRAPAAVAPKPAPAPQPADVSAASGAEGLLAWSRELRDDFARLARDPASAAAGFIARRRPHGAALGPEGATLLDGFEGAKLWAVRAPGGAADPEVWALTPGEAAVLNWSAHFAPHCLEVAAEVFGPAFDLTADGEGALRLDEPALVRRDGAGRLLVRRRGRLSGFRS